MMIKILRIIRNFIFGLNSRKTPVPLTAGTIHRINMFDMLLGSVSGLTGDIVECGVGHGRSLLMITSISTRYDERTVFAFDSFEGFPDVSELDSAHNPSAVKGHYKSDLESVKIFLTNSGLPVEYIQNIVFVTGFFENTLKNFVKPIVFLHIDADLSTSYSTVLMTLFDQVVAGGIILFDEYNESKWAHTSIIINEFMKDKDVRWGVYKTDLIEKYYVIKQ